MRAVDGRKTTQKQGRGQCWDWRDDFGANLDHHFHEDEQVCHHTIGDHLLFEIKKG